ncbi:MAG: hypothetical protein ACREPV_05750 [Lysobacter sp.]
MLLTALVLAVSGCAAPSTNDHGDAPTRDTAVDLPVEATTPASTTAPIQNPPRPPQLPPIKRPSPRPALGPGLGNARPGGDTVEIDRSCNTDAECTVKDVGNCCGYYPACVNVDSPTDPEGVKAQCAKTGMASVCGFPAITSCQCVAGQCQGSSKALLE